MTASTVPLCSVSTTRGRNADELLFSSGGDLAAGVKPRLARGVAPVEDVELNPEGT